MSGKQYWKNQLPVILIHLLGMLSLDLFLIAGNTPIQTVVFITVVWSLVLFSACCVFISPEKNI